MIAAFAGVPLASFCDSFLTLGSTVVLLFLPVAFAFGVTGNGVGGVGLFSSTLDFACSALASLTFFPASPGVWGLAMAVFVVALLGV